MYPDMYPVTQIIKRNHQISFSILFATSHFLLSASVYLRQSHPFTFWSVKLDRIRARFKCDVTLCIKRLTKIFNGLKTLELVCHERMGASGASEGVYVDRHWVLEGWRVKPSFNKSLLLPLGPELSLQRLPETRLYWRKQMGQWCPDSSINIFTRTLTVVI